MLSMEVEWTNGLLPPPSMLRGYEEAIPGSARQIMEMAHDETRHRRELERKEAEAGLEAIRRQFDEGARAQTFALLVCLGFLSVAAYALFLNAPWVAGLFGIGGLSGIVTSFLRGRVAGSSETVRSDNKSSDQ